MATAHAAARDGDLVELARQVRLDAGALRHTDEFGRTPLHWAALRGHRVMVEWLLANGANPDIRDRDGFTPVALAAHGPRLDDRRAADKRAAAASSWPYPQVWRWGTGRALRLMLFVLFLAVCVFGLVLVRPGGLGRNWNTVEAIAEPRLLSGDYAHKPLKAMAGSGDTLAVLTEDGEVYLLDTETRLSRTLCRGVVDLASDEAGVIWLLRADGGIDRAFPLAVGGFTVSAWQPPAERFWKNQEFKSADVLATDIDADGWLVAVPGGVARYRMNPDGSARQRTWQTGDLSAFATRHATVTEGGVWLAGTSGGVRCADRQSLNSVARRELAAPPIATLNAGHKEPWASVVATTGQTWLYPPTDTGWIGPLFAPAGSPGLPSADAVRAAVLQPGGMYAGTGDGLFRYDPRQRRFHALGAQPVAALVPVAERGVCWVGDGLRFVPASARDAREVVVLEDGLVRGVDVSVGGGLCVYRLDGPAGQTLVRAVSPDGGTPVLLASNDGWKRPGGAFAVRGVTPFAGGHLVLTDAGAFKYAADTRSYEDRSASADGLLGFRAAFHHRAANEVLGVTGNGTVYRTDETTNVEQPWAKVDLGGFVADAVVTTGTTVAVTGIEVPGKEPPARGLLAKVGDANPVLVASRRFDTADSPANTAIADLHTPADGGYRLTVAGPPKGGKLPVFTYTSTASETELASVPWADAAPPKQLRWHPTAGLLMLKGDGSVLSASGATMFGSGSSPIKPTTATAIAPVPPAGMILAEGGRVAEYDWMRGSWLDRPQLPAGETVAEVGAGHGLAFARTAAGVYSHAVGGQWQKHPDAVRWLTWDNQGWLIGPDGARPTSARLNPDARPDRANATGIPAFLATARHVWRPSPTAGDWVAFTDTNAIGRYSATYDSWLEMDISGFKRLHAVAPHPTDGAVLKTDTGLVHLNPDVRTTPLTVEFNRDDDTAAVTAAGVIVAAGSDPRTGYLRTHWWRKGKDKEPPFVREGYAERAAEPVPPTGVFDPVVAAASDTGLLLLDKSGRVIEYNPDRGVWATVRQPDNDDELIGWYDGTPFHVVIKTGDTFRMFQFGADATATELFRTPSPPDQWPEMVRRGLPPIVPPAGWVHRRLKEIDPEFTRPGGFALAGGLLRSARQWHTAALTVPGVLKTTPGPFPWTRGTGVEAMRDKAGAMTFRLTDGKTTRPLTPRPGGGFAEDRFARIGLSVNGDVWGIQDDPRQLVKLVVRNGGLARDLATPPLELPDNLDPQTAPNGGLEFRDRFRPGLFRAILDGKLVASPHRHAPPLPAVPVGDAVLTFERSGEKLTANLSLGDKKLTAWHKTAKGKDRPAWSVGTDAALAGKSILLATPLGLVVRDRDTFAVTRIVPTDNPVSFVRDGAGEVARIDTGADSFAWIEGAAPLQKMPRDAVTRTLATGPWQWRIRHLSADARRVELLADAGGRKRTEVELPGGRWAFADDRANWLGKAADGADLFLATDDGIWPLTFDGAEFAGRGGVLLPGERVAKVRCPVGGTWAKSDGANWSAVQRGTFAPLPNTAVPPAEAVLPRHPAWAGTLTDGVLSLTATDGVNRPAFVGGQPYFDRLDGLAAVGTKLFTLSAGRAVIERDPADPVTVLAVRPLPADLPDGWPHHLEHVGGGLLLAAKNPAADEWRAWQFDPVGPWAAVADVPAARAVADTGPFRWQPDSVGGPLVPVPTPEFVGGGDWKGSVFGNWWWHDTRFAWDAVTASAALSDSSALLVTAAGPVRVDVANGRATVARVWPGTRFASVEATRQADGQKTGVRISGDAKPVYFDAGTQLPAVPPDDTFPRESVVTLGPTAAGIGFTARWEVVPERRFRVTGDVGVPLGSLFVDGQFAFDRASAACPLPGVPDRWATVTPEGLVCVFDVPANGGVVLKSVTKGPTENATAMRAASADGVLLLVPPEPDPLRPFEKSPTWVPLAAGAKPPLGNAGRDLFRAGSRVTVDPVRMLWTRTDRFLTDGQPAVPRHDTGREVFYADSNGVAVAVDVGIGIAVGRNQPKVGAEVAVLTRGGLVRTTPADLSAPQPAGDTALSFPNATSAAVPGGTGGSGGGTNRVRYGPTGEVWVRGTDGMSARWGKDDWRGGFGGWEEQVWTVAGRRVMFPQGGGVRVNGVAVTASNNSWRVAWQRPFGEVLDAYPRRDVIWAATRANGVFKVHPDKLIPDH